MILKKRAIIEFLSDKNLESCTSLLLRWYSRKGVSSWLELEEPPISVKPNFSIRPYHGTVEGAKIEFLSDNFLRVSHLLLLLLLINLDR